MRTVELIPDPALDAEVRTMWARLAAAGLPSLANHPHPTNRPHLTLAAGEFLPALDLELPVPVTLDGLLRFDGSAMLAWRVLPSPQLSALQARVWAALDDPNPLREPGRWVPHISLARHFKTDFKDFDPGVRRHGHFVAARSYDSETRTITALWPTG